MHRTILAALLLSACAARPEAVAPVYTESPLRYAAAGCPALAARAAVIDGKIAEVFALQEAIAKDDEIAGAVGFVFTPAFWLVPAYKENPAAELAMLKGDRRARSLALRESGCAAA